jgi:hypothetical protein
MADLSPARIASAVRAALTMPPVVASPGGPSAFADAVEEIAPVELELEAHDRSFARLGPAPPKGRSLQVFRG